MRQKSTRAKDPAEKTVRDIRRRTRKQYSAEEKIRIVLEGLRGEDSIAALSLKTSSRYLPQRMCWRRRSTICYSSRDRFLLRNCVNLAQSVRTIFRRRLPFQAHDFLKFLKWGGHECH